MLSSTIFRRRASSTAETSSRVICDASGLLLRLALIRFSSSVLFTGSWQASSKQDASTAATSPEKMRMRLMNTLSTFHRAGYFAIAPVSSVLGLCVSPDVGERGATNGGGSGVSGSPGRMGVPTLNSPSCKLNMCHLSRTLLGMLPQITSPSNVSCAHPEEKKSQYKPSRFSIANSHTRLLYSGLSVAQTKAESCFSALIFQ